MWAGRRHIGGYAGRCGPLTLACPEQSQEFVTALYQHVTTWGQAADSLLHGQDFQSAIPVLRQSSQDLPALIERLRGIQEEVRRMTRPPAPSQCVPPCWAGYRRAGSSGCLWRSRVSFTQRNRICPWAS